MSERKFGFIKKTYTIWILAAIVVAFFFAYNRYIVDHSLVSLKLALNKLNDAKTLNEVQRIASLLDYSLLSEVSARELKSTDIAQIELVKDILDKPQDMNQVKDARVILTKLVKQKERGKPAILSTFDNLFVPMASAPSKASLRSQAKGITSRIQSIKEKRLTADAYYNLANIYTQLGEFQEARAAYQKVIDIAPDSSLSMRSRFNIAWNEKLQGNFDEAIKEFEVVAQSARDEKLSILSTYQIADVYKKKGDFKKAIETYRKIKKEFPNLYLARMADLQVSYIYLYDLGESEKAAELAKEAISILEDEEFGEEPKEKVPLSVVEKYRWEGYRLLQEGFKFGYSSRYKEAIALFDKALRADIRDGLSYTGKALAYLWLDDVDRALLFARKAVVLLPKDEITSVNLGYIYIKLGLVGEAILEYKRFVAVNSFTSRGYYNLGYAFALQERYEEAVESFTKASILDPKFSQALNNLGWCLWQLDKFSDAIDVFERAIVVDPQFIDPLLNLGMVYARVEKFEEAQKKFAAVLAFDPENFEAKSRLKEVEAELAKRKKPEQ